MRRLIPIVSACALAAGGSRAQHAAPLANAALTHVGVAVRDVQTSAQAYAAALGVPAPAITTITTDLPGGGSARFKTAVFALPNFRIDLGQPEGAGADNPYTAFLAKHGDGIQHLGFVVPGGLPDRVKQLLEKGGVLILGRPGGTVAFLDFTDLLGTTLEITQDTASSNPAASPAPPGTLGSSAVAHVGLILRDVEQTAVAFADLLGASAPQYIVAKGIDFPPDYTGDRSAEVKISMARVGGLTLELQQDPQDRGGPNPWNDSAKRLGGNGVEHVAFTIAGDLDAIRAHLAKQGGREVLGGPGSRYPHYEMFSKLGMMIELLGTPGKK